MTRKARIINQLDSLSETEKSSVIEFFSKYPVYENQIDWNSNSLTYGDFKKVFKTATGSKNNIKRNSGSNPEALFKGHKCRIISRTKNFIIVMPLDWECAVFFNSFNCGGTGAKWCIGSNFNFYHWNNYIKSKDIFYLIFFIKKHPVYGKKLMLQYNRKDNNLLAWDENDNMHTHPFENFKLPKAIINDINSLRHKDLPKKIDKNNSLNHILPLKEKYGYPSATVNKAMSFSLDFLGKNNDTYKKTEIESILKKVKKVHRKLTETNNE